jgi:TetR/AcrR family transcriptional regulator, hemagglutinin/protease regulatory protein
MRLCATADAVVIICGFDLRPNKERFVAVKKAVGTPQNSKPGSFKPTKKSTQPKASKRARAQRLAPNERKRQLLECALTVFSEKGLSDGKHADLAKAAAVAVPTTFHYYPTREELIKTALDEVSRFLLNDVLVKNHDKKLPVPQTLKNILLAFTDSIESHPHYVRVWLEWSACLRGSLWELYLAFYKKAIRDIKAILRRGRKEGTVHEHVDIDAAARVIVSLAHMITHMKFAGNSRKTIELTLDSLLRGYLVA